MPDDEFSDLRSLLSKLTPGEIKNLRAFLSSFHWKAADYQPRSLRLVDLLIGKKVLTIAAAKDMICPEMSDNAFSQMLARLRQKIYDSLLLDMNLKKPGAYSGYYAMKFSLRKQLSQAEILQGRGLIKEATKLYRKIITGAKKFELYDTLIEALTLYRNCTGLRFGTGEFEELTKEIKSYERCRKATENSRMLYHKFITKNEFHGHPEDYLAALKTALDKMENDYRLYHSEILFFHWYMLRILFHREAKDFTSIKNLCLELRKHVMASPALKMKWRIGAVNMLLCDNCLKLFDLKSALFFARDARKAFTPGTFNYLYAIEHEYFALFFMGKLNEAEDIINELLSQSDRKKSPFRYDHRMYLKACVTFLRGKHNETHDALQGIKELYKDREGWNIAARILHIMNLVERGKLDTAEGSIENMRRHIKETMKMKPVSERNMLVLQLLLTLVNEGFDFKKTILKREEMLHMLAGEDEDYRWEILTPELIPFHKWFMAKAGKKKYQVAVSVPAT